MARKARDYKAEYARRIASARGRGKTMREARGHAREPEERRQRRMRTYQQHGVSPERLAKARKAFVEHMINTLGAVTTRNHVDRAIITKHARLLPLDIIEDVILQTGATEIQNLARRNYQEMILEYPELENDEERNPLWYAPDISYAR